MPLSVLIDTDPGLDDAMALLVALRSPELNVLAVTTVFGNAGVEQTAPDPHGFWGEAPDGSS